MRKKRDKQTNKKKTNEATRGDKVAMKARVLTVFRACSINCRFYHCIINLLKLPVYNSI